MGRVEVRGLRFFGFHGCLPEERTTGGEFEVDIIAETDVAMAAREDRIEDAVDYVTLMDISAAHMRVPKNLIETVAQGIADEIKQRFSQVSRVEVSVRKLMAPVSHDHDYVSVTAVVD